MRGIDLEIADGEFFSLIGPSGCGKTTTLQMISGLQQPTGGRVEVHGRDMTRRPAAPSAGHDGLPELRPVPAPERVRERRLRPARAARASKEVRAPAWRACSASSASRAASAPSRAQLSGGQQQRVALARSLVLEPEVLLLDEPLGALDLKLRKQLQVLLKEVQREVGITFVYVTHDQEEAFSMSDRVAVMNLGRIEQIGRPREVYPRPTTLFVAGFVGASNRFPRRPSSGSATAATAPTSGELGTWDVARRARPRHRRRRRGDRAPRAGARRHGRRHASRVDGRVADVSFLGPAAHLTVDAPGRRPAPASRPAAARPPRRPRASAGSRPTSGSSPAGADVEPA